MTTDGGQRIATADGAMLADPASLGNVSGTEPDVAQAARGGMPGAVSGTGLARADFFEPSYWAGRGGLRAVNGGRGAAWFIDASPHRWVLRHYRRGGAIARLSRDRYVWLGEERVRAFAEWRLLAALHARGLPVPKPIAARYRRTALLYRCDLITQHIPGTESLSALLARTSVDVGVWREIGATVARLHAAGVDHADLNAHNILIGGVQGGSEGARASAGERGTAGTDELRVSVIDFDRGVLRGAGRWTAHNVARLRRSLLKVARNLPPERFSDVAWAAFLDGYGSVHTLVR